MKFSRERKKFFSSFLLPPVENERLIFPFYRARRRGGSLERGEREVGELSYATWTRGKANDMDFTRTA